MDLQLNSIRKNKKEVRVVPNRQQRRKLSKKVKAKLTPEEYQDYKKWVLDETVKAEVDRRVKEMFESLMNDIIQSMKEHRISEERIKKIVDRVLEIGEERRKNEARVSK